MWRSVAVFEEQQQAQQALLFLILLLWLAMCPKSMAACCIGRRRKSGTRGSKRVAVLPLLLVVTASQLRELGTTWGHIARCSKESPGASLCRWC